MNYVVCQTPKCQQTYPIEQFALETKDANCDKCGGVLIENGRANLSQNAAVIPVITPEEIERNRKERLKTKREELAELQSEIHELELEV